MPQILMPYTVHLDHTLRVTPLNTLFAKGDSAAHRFELTILSASVQEDLTGCTVLGKFYRMADSTVVSVPGTVEGGNAVVALTAACYDYIGRFALTIAIKNGEDETTVFYGDGYMHGQRADTAISGEYIIYDIDTLLEKIAEIDAATQAANTATENANTAASNANAATGKANTAASAANTAAANANTAKDSANAAAGKINNMTVSATPASTGTATAELSTIDGHYHLALGLPKGDTGATPQISVQVQTGAAGSEASVSISGTAEEPVIHLTIPRGDTGRIENLTINGKPVESGTITLTAADVGALPTGGTASDSSKLGGKAPEYYINPKNLLRNANFREPVNTVGFSSGNTVGAWAGETVNEWYAYVNGATITLTISGISLLNGIYQEMSAVDLSRYEGKSLTFAAKINGVVYAAIGAVNQTGAWHIIGESATPYGSVRAEIQNDNKLYCIILNDTEATIEWAALYEGSYTADNVPPPFFYPQRLEMLNLGIPVQPRNLLDNSDFTNPVNQRGQTSYNSVGYTIDRWTKESNAILTIADDCINIDNSANSAEEVLLQKVDSDTAAKLIGKTVTIAICTSDGTVYAKSGVVAYDVPIAVIEHNGFSFQLQFFRTASSYQVARLIIWAGSNISVKWAALYEGSYTAETLPPYVPKGYAAELAACNSGLVEYGGGYGGGSLQAYPVGSIYLSTSPTSPASLFGGTWEQIKERFLLGAGDSYAAGGTGGEATHTLTRNEIPNYKIGDLAVSVPALHANWDNLGITASNLGNVSSSKPGEVSLDSQKITSGIQYGYQINSYGGGGSHNNMPPYLAVYMWKRVS